ncbi:MAG: hypothetical protein RMZ42_00725 [Nostoc sp. DedQUE05]|uniref:hypothetical protein n=1 Tax=Nostoc sp. DedQUE05 TaxID=3075391 RepID=UPI002AD4944F|nr:hypothetical protein [Nostoc sp. DedQUE05]MDZ8090464.1 hypothetical protein [Nostoc sp. DedQUE05]
MTKAKTKASPSNPTDLDTNLTDTEGANLDPRLTQIIHLYTLGQHEYDGIRDYPKLDKLDFASELEYWIYLQGFEGAIYDQSFKPELDDPELLEYSEGSYYRGWKLRGKEYIQEGYWIIRWTNSLGQTGRTKVNA